MASYLSHHVLPIDKGFEPADCRTLPQWEDVLGLDGHFALVGVLLENDDLLEGGRHEAKTRVKKTSPTASSQIRWVSFPNLREQVNQFTLHVDGLKGELLTGAVQESRCDVLQRVCSRPQVISLVTGHCTRKKSPLKSRTGKRHLSRLFPKGRQNMERDLMNGRQIGHG